LRRLRIHRLCCWGSCQDIILKIDGKNTEVDVNAAVALIRGQPGTVTLTILNGQQKQFPIKQARLKSIRDIKYQNTPTGAVGYIRLNQFSANAATEMRDAIKDLERSRWLGIFWICVPTRRLTLLQLPRCG